MSHPQVLAYVHSLSADVADALAFKKPVFDGIPNRWLIDQFKAREKAKYKLPSWYDRENLIYPALISMEQCSSEATGMYKAQLFGIGASVWDVTGGFGVDSYYLSLQAQKVVHVEPNSDLSLCVQHNFRALGVSNVEFYTQTFETCMQQSLIAVDHIIYIDPSRRDEAKNKKFKLEDCSPNLVDWMPLLMERGHRVWCKLSAFFDISELIRIFSSWVKSIHVVAYKNDCKELLVEFSPFHSGEVRVCCVNLDTSEPAVEASWGATAKPELAPPFESGFLYEPNAAVLKAGLSDGFAVANGMFKLHPNTQLYYSSQPVSHFPGRCFAINYAGSLSGPLEKQFPEKKANIACRNFPISPEEVRKKLGFADGGEQYFFACTAWNQKKILIGGLKVTSN